MDREAFPSDVAPQLVTDFVEAHKEYTESPDEFLGLVPLFVAGVLAGRWVTFNKQSLNNYYLIVGQTGTVKKSTAQDLGMKLLSAVKDAHGGLTYSPISVEETEKPAIGPTSAYPVVSQFSIEGLQTHALGFGTSTAVNMGEYKTLFAIGRRQSQGNTIAEITNMYDGNVVSVKTISRDVFVENYAISLFAASTGAWLKDFCSDENIGGGFVNRHLIAMGEPVRILPKPRSPDKLAWASIVGSFRGLIPADLSHQLEMGKVRWTAKTREIAWTPETESVWEEYYRQKTIERRALTSPVLAELSAREMTHAIKVTGLSAFLEGREAITMKDLEFGARMARWSAQNAISMATPATKPASDPEAIVASRLKRSGAMSKTDLARMIGGDQKEINKAIRIMIAKEELEIRPDGLMCLVGDSAPNSQLEEKSKYFGKSNICDLIQKLGVGNDQQQAVIPPRIWNELQETKALSLG